MQVGQLRIGMLDGMHRPSRASSMPGVFVRKSNIFAPLGTIRAKALRHGDCF
jgi:hypothetical protein